MDVRTVKKLIELMEASSITELEITQDNEKIRLSSHKMQYTTASPAPQPAAATIAEVTTTSEIVKDDFNQIKSPIVGTFYASPGPDAPPFVQVGRTVKKGDVICIVEAMKIMNRVVSEHEGELVEIMVNDQDPVEYGQVLMLIK